MILDSITSTPHPLKAELKKHKVPFWKVVRFLNKEISEASLSRMLSGVSPLPAHIEKKLQDLVTELNGSSKP